MLTSHHHNATTSSSSSSTATMAGPTFATSEMQSVAKKIEERYKELAKEQQSYERAVQEHEERDQTLQDAREAHQGTRVTYLEEVRQTQGVELEFHRLQQEDRSFQQHTEKSIEQQREIEEQYHRLEESWSKEQETMAAAVTKREWYLRCIRGAIQHTQDLQLLRKRKILFLKKRTAALVAQRDEVEQGTERVRGEIETLEREDCARDRHVQDTTEQVRAQLAKRTELRDSLREAQQAYRNANDEAFLREREFTDLKAIP